MFKKEKNFYLIEEFKELGVSAIYTEADFDFEEFSKGRTFLNGYQTHSSNIACISKDEVAENLYFEDTDGFITDRKDLTLVTKHADCLAIYFYDTKNEVIGLCHSGWKGSFEEISIKMLEKMKNIYHSQKENIIIGIGIGISQKNYEVSEEFYRNFCNRFSKKILENVFKVEENKYFFDNEKFNLNLLLDYGIKEKNIVMSGLCTYSDMRLNSYRRDREKSGRNRAYIFFSGCGVDGE